MSYKTIFALTTIESEAGALPTAPLAFSLAQRWKASLTLLIRVPQLTSVIHGGVAGGAVVLNEDDKEGIQKAEALAEKLSTNAKQLGLSFSVIIAKDEFDDILNDIACRGRMHELILIRNDQKTSSLIIETALFETGRPCLLVPNGASPDLPLQRVTIAWDGGLQAARALHEAMPILSAAAASEVVTISGEKKLSKSCRGKDLAELLKAHGLAVTTTDMPANGDVGTLLMDHAHASKADLIVLGAYAHSRFRQMIFGGVTSTILAEARLPVLMAH
jgi:nucleotide-binding universal stress UspA family protein